MLINKKQFTLATLRITKTQEMAELEQKSMLEDILLKKYKKLRFWIPVLLDFVILFIPFLYMDIEFNIFNTFFLTILAIIINILTAHWLDTYYEKKFKENNIEIYDDLKPHLIDKFKNSLQNAVKNELEKEEIKDYKIMYFGINSTPFCYEIPVQYNEKIF